MILNVFTCLNKLCVVKKTTTIKATLLQDQEISKFLMTSGAPLVWKPHESMGVTIMEVELGDHPEKKSGGGNDNNLHCKIESLLPTCQPQGLFVTAGMGLSVLRLVLCCNQRLLA